MEQEEPSAADLSSTFVVSDDEDAEILRSLHASLLVQAPLQVLVACRCHPAPSILLQPEYGRESA